MALHAKLDLQSRACGPPRRWGGHNGGVGERNGGVGGIIMEELRGIMEELGDIIVGTQLWYVGVGTHIKAEPAGRQWRSLFFLLSSTFKSETPKISSFNKTAVIFYIQ